MEIAPRVGDRVGVRFGQFVIAATVLEDRGTFRGRHLLRVSLDDDVDEREGQAIEIPADELVAAPAAA